MQESLVFSITQFKHWFDTWVYYLIKTYYFARVRKPFEEVILFWKTSVHPLANNLSMKIWIISWDNLWKYSKMPFLLSFFLCSSFSSFHSFSNSNVQDYPANLRTVPALPKAPCAVQLPFTNSQSPRFTTENIPTQNPLTSRLLVKSTPRSI